MIANSIHKDKCGIYCIRNIVNNKVYIGKSQNISRRIRQHVNELNKSLAHRENSYFIAAWHKYGKENFDYFVLEFLEKDENILKERELYWIKVFNSTNRKFGYNLRQDSSTNCITHEDTSKKISTRLKKEWKSGIRSEHGNKLKEYWSKNSERKEQVGKQFTQSLTKYEYHLYSLEGVLIEICDYQRLKELKLKNMFATMQRKNTNIIKFKNFIIEKIRKDIVQTTTKVED